MRTPNTLSLRHACLLLGLFSLFCCLTMSWTVHSRAEFLAETPQFIVTNTNDSGVGSLRQAIIDANASAEGCRISFNISSGSGVRSIVLTSPLPTITVSVSIDGWSQSGDIYIPYPRIELNGSQAGPDADGLIIAGGNSIVDGLIINRFSGAGIKLQNKGSNLIFYNYLGTDVKGTGAQGNGVGLSIEAGSNDNSAQFNLISGNDGDGVHISSKMNLLRRNTIGLDTTRLNPLGNRRHGILILNGAENTIGASPDAPDGNIIMSNGGDGIRIQGAGSIGNKIRANYIGAPTDVNNRVYRNSGNGISITDSASSNIIGEVEYYLADRGYNYINSNGGAGVLIDYASNNVVRFNSIDRNMVAGVRIESGSNNSIVNCSIQNNAGDGVLVRSGLNNSVMEDRINNNSGAGIQVNDGAQSTRILSNSINANGRLGIDLGPEGVTPNDAGDLDAGANKLQNFPVLASVIASVQTHVTGFFNSTPETTFQLEFFSQQTCDPSGYGEGQNLVSSMAVTTGGDGEAKLDFIIDGNRGEFLAATATDPNGNTSEFSSCVPILKRGFFAFESPAFSVNEDAGAALITVKRIGGTSGPVSVAYATSDGTATAGVDYMSAGGTLNFADGETTKTFAVSILNDSVMEGVESVKLTLSNPAGGAEIEPSDAAPILVIMDEPTEPGTNPIDNAEFFVRQHYLDFLGREPDPEGLAYWTQSIAACEQDVFCIHHRRIGTSAAFFIEKEFQQTGYFIYRTYRAALGRAPAFSEFRIDRSRITDGPELESQKLAFVAEFTERLAFKSLYPDTLTNEQFVNQLFDRAGIEPAEASREFYIRRMNEGATRADVLRGAIDNMLFAQKEYNPAFVLMQYFGYLQRDPDEGGYLFWLDVLNNRERNNYGGMVCAFITSAEYQKRFGTVVRHSNSECSQ